MCGKEANSWNIILCKVHMRATRGWFFPSLATMQVKVVFWEADSHEHICFPAGGHLAIHSCLSVGGNLEKVSCFLWLPFLHKSFPETGTGCPDIGTGCCFPVWSILIYVLPFNGDCSSFLKYPSCKLWMDWVADLTVSIAFCCMYSIWMGCSIYVLNLNWHSTFDLCLSAHKYFPAGFIGTLPELLPESLVRQDPRPLTMHWLACLMQSGPQ